MSLKKIKFALIGIDHNPYGCQLLNELIKNNLPPEYIICEEFCSKKILETKNYVEKATPTKDIMKQQAKLFMKRLKSYSFTAVAKSYKIPCFSVEHHNSNLSKLILERYPVDVLIITQGPIIKKEILYSARKFLMNIHAAPLPEYRGNWATAIAKFNCEKLYVSSHVVTNEVDRGPIIHKVEVPTEGLSSINDLNYVAIQKALECAVSSLVLIDQGELSFSYQKLWEGITWRGNRDGDYFYPAMPLCNQVVLNRRLELKALCIIE